MLTPDLATFAAFANGLADLARATIRETFDVARSFTIKEDASPVTSIDRRVEERLRAAVQAAHPHHGFLGEEFDSFNVDAEWVWVIDPIDGTKAFITGIPTFGTLIGLVHQGIPVLGVIDNPSTGERWIGGDGLPTRYNGRLVQPRACGSLSEAILGNGNPEPFDMVERTAFIVLRRHTRWCVYGGGCHAYGRVADGGLDINVDGGLDPFDYCALTPIVRNAGGMMTDWRGDTLTIHSGNCCVLATATVELHKAVLGLLE